MPHSLFLGSDIWRETVVVSELFCLVQPGAYCSRKLSQLFSRAKVSCVEVDFSMLNS